LKITRPLKNIRYKSAPEEIPLWFFEDVDLPAVDYSKLNWESSRDSSLLVDEIYNKRDVAPWGLNETNPDVIQIRDIVDSIIGEIEKNHSTNNLEIIWPMSTWNPCGCIDIKNDREGFNMGKHLDNRNIKWTFIMNLEDNEESTIVHLDYFDAKDVTAARLKNSIHSPRKRGSGLMFFNHQAMLHSIGSISSHNRYIAFQMNTVTQ